MKYLLDADWSIDYLSGIRAARSLFPTIVQEGVAVSIVTQIELYTGAYGGPNPGLALRQLRAFLRVATILPLDQHIMRRTARLRAMLRGQKLPIKHRAYDLIVAATALQHHLTLVTSNVRDYQDVPGLRLMNPRERQ